MEASIRRILAVAALSLVVCPARAASGGAHPGQETLDYLASVPIARTSTQTGGIAIPDAPFQAWSPNEQTALPRRVAGFCSGLWTMAHDAPGTRILPADQPASDEQNLGTAICIAAHMPTDWPRRDTFVRTAKDIIARAHALGSPLQLPASIER